MSKWKPCEGFWTARNIAEPKVEHRVCHYRQWRFDFAWPERNVALEVEGGIWMRRGFGGHNRGSGMVRDMEKYNEATKLGWKVYRFSSDQMGEVKTAEFLREVLR